MLVNETQIQADLKKVENKFIEDISTIRIGRPTPAIFDNIFVEYYGASTAISYMSQVMIDGMSVVIKPFDPKSSKLIEDALRAAELSASINPSQTGSINVNFTPMTMDTRREKIKELNKMLEEARIAVRQNVRRKYMEELGALEKVPEDEKKRTETRVQELVDKSIADLEKIASEKEEEILPAELALTR